jgi:hypothetical protein
MSDLLDKMQNKSRRFRVVAAWLAVSLIMVIIFTLWAVNLKSHLSAVAQKNQEQTDEQFTQPLSKIGQTSQLIKEKVPTLLDAIKDLFANLFSVFNNQTSDLEEAADNINQQRNSE